ncbi:YceI family protein, partial [Klebsiella pneumoniae]|uniref:YceI family protein n=1 Tax=Klebsiella pneumoniae TaxID=573 RepID=UPI0013D2587F
LTIHGITKQVTLDLVHKGTIENPMNKKTTSGFQLTGTIKRSDFDLAPKTPSAILSNEVKIKADGEFTK